ncbi:hypothetical protein GPJ56_004837 [Histomonas meleagridis]|uniref:uncharacterized protein n=1 Tax=Histomonas meleagridis TaxID=135588 RepID=UPI00355A179E|nr:hypothetical protein GPJ56_004837 [Histomonas meleagridis]KAH0803488.1 hypothetical protein GO595_003832 [Histomonas meleagridis]
MMPELSPYINAIVELYDVVNKKVVHSWVALDKGTIELSISNSILPQQAVFSVSPIELDTYDVCDVKIFPVIFGKAGDTSVVKSFVENFTSTICRNPEVYQDAGSGSQANCPSNTGKAIGLTVLVMVVIIVIAALVVFLVLRKKRMNAEKDDATTMGMQII